MRVITNRGAGTVTGFNIEEYYDIGVLLDGETEERYTDWRNARPLDA